MKFCARRLNAWNRLCAQGSEGEDCWVASLGKTMLKALPVAAEPLAAMGSFAKNCLRFTLLLRRIGTPDGWPAQTSEALRQPMQSIGLNISQQSRGL